MLPSQFVDLDDQEKAFIIAAIDIRGEAEEKQRKKIEKVKPAGKRRGKGGR